MTSGATAATAYDAIRRSRLVAILRSSDSGALVAGAEALVEEGVTTLELPLTSPNALDAVARACDVLSGRAQVGAGTVRTVDDASRAMDAGARFLVSPSFDGAVVEHALAQDVAALPGIVTPTEYEAARAAGAAMVKLFPAQPLGPAHLGHLRVPFPELEAVPTGGIGLDDVAGWFAAGAVAVGVGSPLTGRFLEDRDMDGLRAGARAWKAAVS